MKTRFLTPAIAVIGLWAAPSLADDTATDGQKKDAPKQDAAKKVEPAKAPSDSATEAAIQSVLLSNDPVTHAYDAVQEWKKDNGIPIGVGAWHWWHMNRESPHDFHYGLPTLGGTYYYYVTADPQTEVGGDKTKIGAHVDFRFRDGEESFRSFYESNAWLWEAYAWVQTGPDTKVKAGKIWHRFGVDWDGSWYGNVPYFDGWKLDPDWGASLETKFDVLHTNADAFLQAYFAQDRVNGSIPGADAESNVGNGHEKPSLNARLVPTWTLPGGSTLAVGASAMIGQIAIDGRDDETVAAGALDATWTKGPWKAVAEIMASSGERNPTNYVTGGPSDQSQLWLVGASRTIGPVTLRGIVSHGRYDDPGGEQVLYLTGATIAITKNVDLYLEYVKWDTKSGNGRVPYEDGFQFVLNWRF